MVDRRYLYARNKIGYGSGDIAGNTIYAFLSTFLMFYLTDTVGMDLAVVGVLMAISKLLDALTDLFFGNILDRTSTKMGKARPWMLLGYVGCSIMLAAIFMTPASMGQTAQYIYFFITYTLLNATLTALITKNTSERVQLGCIRYIFAFATTMIIQTVTIDLVSCFGGGAAGWKVVAVGYAMIGLVVNTISCLCVKELPEEDLYKTDLVDFTCPEKPCSVAEGFRLLFENKYYMMICGIYLLTQLLQSTMSLGVYYTKYALGNENLLKTFSMYSNIPMIIGLILTPILVKQLRGMYKLNFVGSVVSVFGRLGMLIGAYMGNIFLMLAFAALSSIGSSPMHGGFNALIASCSEYTFLTKGRRIDGTMYACSSFGIKAGAAIGTALCGWLMSASGYVENAAVQPQETVTMLRILYLWVPIILSTGISVFLSRLDVEKANEKVMANKFQVYLNSFEENFR